MGLILRKNLNRPLTHDELDSNLVYLDINEWKLQSYEKGVWVYIKGAGNITALYLCEATHNKNVYPNGAFTEVVNTVRIWRPFEGGGGGTGTTYFQNPLPTTAHLEGIPPGSTFPSQMTMQEMWDLLLYPYIPPPGPYFAVTPLQQIVEPASGSTGSFTVTFYNTWIVPKNWIITYVSDWFTVSPVSGANNGTFIATCDANSGYNAIYREGYITITNTETGESHTVTIGQNPEVLPEPYFTVTPPLSLAEPQNGSVAAPPFVVEFFGNWGSIPQTWNVSESTDWFTLSVMNGDGDGSINATCQANIGWQTAYRTGSVTITLVTTDPLITSTTKTVTVAQTPLPLDAPTFIVKPDLRTAAVSGDTVTFNITFYGDWAGLSQNWVVHNAFSTWAHILTFSGTGNGSFSVQCDSNIGYNNAYRFVDITAEALDLSSPNNLDTIRVDQAGQQLDAPYIEVLPTTHNFPATGDLTKVFNVYCRNNWLATSKDWVITPGVNSAWVTSISPLSGIGDGTFTVVVPVNTDYGAQPRAGDLVVTATQLSTGVNTAAVHFTQAASPSIEPYITVTASPPYLNDGHKASVSAEGGTATFIVTCDGDWMTTVKEWTANYDMTEPDNWFTSVAPMIYTGNTITPHLQIVCESNYSGSERTKTLTVSPTNLLPNKQVTVSVTQPPFNVPTPSFYLWVFNAETELEYALGDTVSSVVANWSILNPNSVVPNSVQITGLNIPTPITNLPVSSNIPTVNFTPSFTYTVPTIKTPWTISATCLNPSLTCTTSGIKILWEGLLYWGFSASASLTGAQILTLPASITTVGNPHLCYDNDIDGIDYAFSQPASQMYMYWAYPNLGDFKMIDEIYQLIGGNPSYLISMYQYYANTYTNSAGVGVSYDIVNVTFSNGATIPYRVFRSRTKQSAPISTKIIPMP